MRALFHCYRCGKPWYRNGHCSECWSAFLVYLRKRFAYERQIKRTTNKEPRHAVDESP